MNRDREQIISILKKVTNIVLTCLLGGVALLFTLLALGYRSLPFIDDNYVALAVTAGVLTGVVLLIYVVCFALKKQAAYRTLFCAIICADIFALMFYAICATGLIENLTSVEAVQQYIDGFGAWAVIIFILFCYLQVVVLPVPGSVTVAAGVVLFGWFECAVYSFIGIVLGSVTAFAIGRVLGYKVVCWIVGKDDLDKWLDKIKGKDYLILTLMFLLPLFPDDILCFVAGLSSMTWPFFLVMIVISRLISSFTVTLSLDLIPFTTWWGILIWILLAAAVVAAFWLVLKYSDKIDAFIKSKFKMGERRDKREENKDNK